MASAAGYNLLHHVYTNISAGICICICIRIGICIGISLGDDDGKFGKLSELHFARSFQLPQLTIFGAPKYAVKIPYLVVFERAKFGQVGYP